MYFIGPGFDALVSARIGASQGKIQDHELPEGGVLKNQRLSLVAYRSVRRGDGPKGCSQGETAR